MRAIVTATTGNANQSTATSCGRKRNFLRCGPVVMQTARGLFPNKTARYLSELTGHPVRTWEYWLNKERLSGEAMGTLLQSEHGLLFLDALCASSSWWRRVRRLLAIAQEQEHVMQEAANAILKLGSLGTETAPPVRVPNVASDPPSTVARPKTKT